MASPRASDSPSPNDQARAESAERQLALVDRLIALEVQLAEVTATALSPSDQLRAEAELARLRHSATWRAGRVATAPLRVARRMTGRAPRD